MKQIKFYLQKLGILLLSMLIISFLFSILQSFGIGYHNQIILWVIVLLFSFIIGILTGKNATKNGYLEGLKMSGMILLMLLFLDIIFFQSPFNGPRIIYYLLIIFTNIIGSMIGINKKSSN